MNDVPYFLQVLTGNHETNEDPVVARFHERLDEINEDLAQLKKLADDALPENEKLLERYLDVLSDKCEDIEAELAKFDPNSEKDVGRVRDSLDEARQRLKIARQATKAHAGSLIH